MVPGSSKLAFFLPSKSSGKPKGLEMGNEFDPAKPIKKLEVISRLENTWLPGKKMKDSELQADQKGKALGRAKVRMPYEAVRRPWRLGPGATPAPSVEESAPKRFVKAGESREGRRRDLVAAPGPDGRIRNFVNVGEKLVERKRKGVAVGKIIFIAEGRHVGLRGEVTEVLGEGCGGKRVVMRLCKSEEKVVVSVGDVADVGSVEEIDCLRRLKKMRGTCTDARVQKGYKDKNVSVLPISWLTSQIRVRVISKDIQGGKLYLKKGRVIDVVDQRSCDLLMDEIEALVEGVKQDAMETALPKRGGLVMVVKGKQRGVLGKLLERDSNEGLGLVWIEDTCETLTLSLDHIAEFVGEPEELGY